MIDLADNSGVFGTPQRWNIVWGRGATAVKMSIPKCEGLTQSGAGSIFAMAAQHRNDAEAIGIAEGRRQVQAELRAIMGIDPPASAG